MATQSSTLAWRISMVRGAWRATVHGAVKSRTQLSRLSEAQHGPAQPYWRWFWRSLRWSIGVWGSENSSKLSRLNSWQRSNLDSDHSIFIPKPVFCHYAFFCFFFQCLLEYSCFTMLWSFLLYSKMNRPYIYIYPLPFGLPFPSLSAQHSALTIVSCAV